MSFADETKKNGVDIGVKKEITRQKIKPVKIILKNNSIVLAVGRKPDITE